MKKLSVLFLVVFALMAYSTESSEKKDSLKKERTTLKIKKDIVVFQKIITQKQVEVKSLLMKADGFMGSNDEISLKLIEKANLLQMNCLKYEAAIACLRRHLD